VASPSYLLSLAVLYVCALFAVAWAVDRRSDARSPAFPPRWRAAIYALSLGVYCSSWTFYGAVGSASASPWSHAPIYLGPMLLFLFAWPLIRRVVSLGTRHRVTSIADYLGARFGKRQSLSILVTVVACAAVLPYIALQFRAVTQAWLIVAGDLPTPSTEQPDAGLIVAVLLAVFSILFGARRMDGRERHQGMMSAIALESLVKLLAFFCVALFALAFLLSPEGVADVNWSLQSPVRTELNADFFARTLISACAILCLPRQFHVAVVEAQDDPTARLSRWILPAYLLLFLLLAAPISLAGTHLAAALGAEVSPDAYVQWLPRAAGAPWVQVAAFLGGISAATGMVIVATVSLAIMLTNEVAVPLMVRRRSEAGTALFALGARLRWIRQITIAGILLAAWIVSTQLGRIPFLTEIGFTSFLAAAQLAPGLLAGLYWRRAHGRAVMAGLGAGLLLWFCCLVLPQILEPGSGLLRDGFLGFELLRPTALLGWEGPGPLTYAVVWSLGVNTVLMVTLSLILRPSVADTRQAAVFMESPDEARVGKTGGDDFNLSPVRGGQLLALLPPFLDGSRVRTLWRFFEERYQQRILPADRVPLFAVRAAESELAGVIGAASAGRVIRQLTESRQVDFADLATLVSDAGRRQTFNRALLETTIESMLQGVAVVDAELRLVAWNSRYEELFAYPERLLYVGLPVERLYRYNAERGIMAVGKRSIDEEVAKRLVWLRKGETHRFERRLPDGRVIEIYGVPMAGGGFVTTYTDVTDSRELLLELKEARVELESRLESGSKSLSETITELRQENRLRAEAETQLREVNRSKSRFMSATSHDLLQPINAARLFAAALRQQTQLPEDVAATLGKIDSSLARAEGLISELREIARLDSGRSQPTLAPFAVDPLVRELFSEFAPQAREAGLNLILRSSSLWIHSDRQLLSRALQNLVGNAVKYSRAGKVLVGVRRRPGAVEIQVLDQGPGIPEESLVRIFDEFERLGASGHDRGEGLGLGLSIVRRYADLLDLALDVTSEPARGSCFSLTVRTCEPVRERSAATTSPDMGGRLVGARVICVDNDAQVRDALAAILAAEGCEVTAVADREGLRAALGTFRPDVILADYHLDDGDTGIAALQWALRGANRNVPCIVVSADDSREVRTSARAAGYRMLPKPVNPARLTALIFALTAESGTFSAASEGLSEALPGG